MDKFILWICDKKDNLQRSIEAETDIDKCTEFPDEYKVYKFENNYILTRKEDSWNTSNNVKFWTSNKFGALDTFLQQTMKDNEFLIAIHWGGWGPKKALEHTKTLTDDNFKLEGGNHYLTYYSDNNDNLEWGTVGDTQFQSNSEFILERIKRHQLSSPIKLAIDHWLPLAIDLRGLVDLEGDEGYLKEVKANYSSYQEDPKREEWYLIYEQGAGQLTDIWEELFHNDRKLQSDLQVVSRTLNEWLGDLSKKLNA